MTFLTALATVINSDIDSTRIMDASKSEIDMMEDIAINLGYARQHKDAFEVYVKDAKNPIYCASQQAEYLQCANDERKAYREVQIKLIELSSHLTGVGA